jgi:DNA-binding LytR/AlgR family response regulator
MTTCIIADDEAHLARYLQDQLAKAWPELRVLATAANGVEAAAAITQHNPDIAFLDIQMPGLTGIEVAQGIEGATRVVFVTAYDEYAVAAFDAGAADYILKPVNAERLQKTTERVKKALADNSAPDLGALLKKLTQSALPASAPTAPPSHLRWVRAHERTKDGELTLQIDVAEVMYFDAADKYTVVMTQAGEKLIRVAISELEAQLDPALFTRIHRSTLINLQHVHATRRDDSGRLFVRMKNHPRELPVSRAYHDVFARM